MKKIKPEYVIMFSCELGTILECVMFKNLPNEDDILDAKQYVIQKMGDQKLNINELNHVILPLFFVKQTYKNMKKGWKIKNVQYFYRQLWQNVIMQEIKFIGYKWHLEGKMELGSGEGKGVVCMF